MKNYRPKTIECLSMISILFSIVLACLILPQAACLAATYYVDRNSLQGSCSDLNTGTEIEPFCTIQRASQVVSAGDTVIVRPGDYSNEGIITFARGGMRSGKVTFKAEPRRQAKVQGFNTRNADYLRIEGFEITNNISGNAGDGINVGSNNVDIVDNYIHHVFHRGIESYGANNIYIAHNYMYHVGAGMNINGENWIVENNEIERLVQAVRISNGGLDADYSRFFGRNHVIRNNYFHGTARSEIGDAHTDGFQTYNVNGNYAHNVIIENNKCTGFFIQGIIARDTASDAALTDIVIRNNIFANSPDERGSWGVMGENLKNPVIVNNVFANIRWFGVGLDAASDNAVVKNNIFYNSGDDTVYYSEGSGFNGDYNIIYGGGRRAHVGAHDMVGADPLFVDVSSFNFRLGQDSPAIDAGSGDLAPDRDIEGTRRPQGSGYDIGAYEYALSVAGDVNGDGKINVLDIILTARHVAGLIELEGDALRAANINGDFHEEAGQSGIADPNSVQPKIDILDIILIARRAAGL